MGVGGCLGRVVGRVEDVDGHDGIGSDILCSREVNVYLGWHIRIADGVTSNSRNQGKPCVLCKVTSFLGIIRTLIQEEEADIAVIIWLRQERAHHET